MTPMNAFADLINSKMNSIDRYMAVAQFLRRNLVSISFPVLTATFIYLDWSRTKNWKLQQQKVEN
ncbi:hypothetical protein HW555_011343 [Spodoptera exigua]|uniref:Uncharacterized protein n=1 Tax=Spodoptera exigua TaxID=7107 RepID=A0A835L1Q8_SPOEX|nr:hypothetical protein HW555_011343 [Spodoptera exigua]